MRLDLAINLQKALPSGSYSTAEIAERDEYSAQVGWNTEYLQLEPGRYKAKADFSIHTNTRLARSFSNLKSSVIAAPPEGHLALFLPLANEQQTICQGRLMQKNEVAFICPNSKIVVGIPRDFEMINITMSKADCAPAIRRFTDASSRNFSERIIEMKIPNGLREEIRRICQKIIQYGKRPHTAGLVNSIKKMEQEMIVLLSKAIEDRDQVLPVTRARSNRVSAFFHATDYIIGGLGGPLNIEDVAAHAAVSPRTLEYAFRDCLGIRPVEYIRMRRLAEARRLLLGVKPEQARVSDIAQACGFTHQGFFARDYRLQFLELPSQTLKKRDVLGSE